MNDMSWLNDPRLIGMDPIKMQIILELVAEAKGKSLQQSLPLLMKANNKLKEKNMVFSQEESALIMELLTKDMSPDEKARVESMKQMIMKMKPSR